MLKLNFYRFLLIFKILLNMASFKANCIFIYHVYTSYILAYKTFIWPPAGALFITNRTTRAMIMANFIIVGEVFSSGKTGD